LYDGDEMVRGEKAIRLPQRYHVDKMEVFPYSFFVTVYESVDLGIFDKQP
jgi:hypothetical protein